MRILVVHNVYRERGGEDTAVASDVTMLRAAGHHVDVWMVHNRDLDTSRPLALAARTVWNASARDEAAERARTGQYDIVHVHNTLPQLSPAVFGGFRDQGAAVVASLHNYRMVCPVGTMYRSGSPCMDCSGSAFRLPAIRHACYRDSRPASAVVAAMLATHDIRGTWHRDVDAFVAVSEFVRDTLCRDGLLPSDRIHVRPNALSGDFPDGRGEAGSVLLAGRLVAEKGIADVLDAWHHMPKDRVLVIAGDGPERAMVEARARSAANIRYAGQLERPDLLDLMGSSALTVVPSRWHEPFGLVAIESLATGTPVMVAPVGGLSELARTAPGVGLLPDSTGDPVARAAAIRAYLDQPADRDAIRAHARSAFSASRSTERLLDIYSRALTRRRAS